MVPNLRRGNSNYTLERDTMSAVKNAAIEKRRAERTLQETSLKNLGPRVFSL